MELSQSIRAVILQLILTTCAAYGSDAIDSGIILSVMQHLFCVLFNCTWLMHNVFLNSNNFK